MEGKDYWNIIIPTMQSKWRDPASFVAAVRVIYLLLLLLLKEVGSARLRESDIHPISPITPAPQYQHIDKKKRTEKIVDDYSTDRAA